MAKYVIIPGCSDLNRGDQALVWKTKDFAEKCGYTGEFYLTTEANEPTEQSKKEGLNIIRPILEHPSRKYKNKANIQYTMFLKIKWGLVALEDFIYSLLLLFYVPRKLIYPFLCEDKRHSLDVFYDSDAIFIKGGGLLQSYGGLTSTYSMYFWCYHIFFAHALKKDIYMMPNSLGPFEGPFVRKIAKKALSFCKVVCSREELSKKMVKEQLDMDIYSFPDLAFSLESADIDKDSFFNKYNIPSNRKLVAITMRPYRFPESENPDMAYADFRREMKEFIIWLYNNGFMAVVIEHTLAMNAHENDSSCINDVVKDIDEEMYCIVSNSSYNCRDLKAIYGLFDYIVGTRFHSVIFSLSNNIPGIAICYVGNKAQGIMQDIGLGDYAISIYEVTARLLIDKFNMLLENENEVKKLVRRYNYSVEGKLNDLKELCINGEK